MPRVLDCFTVGGPTRGFPTYATEIALEFVVFDDGSCVAAMLEPAECFVENVSASIDLEKTSAAMAVYACRFTLVQCEEATATRGDVVGLLSETKGLEAQCILHGDPGSLVVSYAVNLPLFDIKEKPETPATDGQADAVGEAVELMDDDEEASPGGANRVQMVFRGKQVDSSGKSYATTLYLAKIPSQTRVEGSVRESSRKSPIEGTWDGDSVHFRQAYSLKKGVVYHYDYEGKAVETVAGTRIVGSWRFAGGDGSQQAYGAVLNGKFDVVGGVSGTKSRRAAP